tara:strand:+ start:826 stop:1011 length:186 start_codon:yes stop_codon:yes gene_type:complete
VKAGKASNDLMNVPDCGIDWARKEQRYRVEEKLNYVNVGATLIEKWDEGCRDGLQPDRVCS